MDTNEILKVNELAIDKWVNKPKLTSKMTLVDKAKLLHETKRFFIVSELKKLHKKLGRPIRVFDFGCGQGGLTIDLKFALGEHIIITGYDVSPKAIEIAKEAAKTFNADVDFILDRNCNPKGVFDERFDAIISSDVFGHVPSVPDTFETLHALLLPEGRLIAFSETITGDALVIPKMLARRGFRMDDSIEEHISLHTVFELKSFLMGAAFVDVKVFPYDPIRFLFYPKRYFGKLLKIRHPLCLVALFLLLFQNRATEIIFNQFNLFLSKFIPLYTTAGCLLVAQKKTR